MLIDSAAAAQPLAVAIRAATSALQFLQTVQCFTVQCRRRHHLSPLQSFDTDTRRTSCRCCLLRCLTGYADHSASRASSALGEFACCWFAHLHVACRTWRSNRVLLHKVGTSMPSGQSTKETRCLLNANVARSPWYSSATPARCDCLMQVENLQASISRLKDTAQADRGSTHEADLHLLEGYLQTAQVWSTD